MNNKCPKCLYLPGICNCSSRGSALVSEDENPWEVLGRGIRNRPDRGTDTEIALRKIEEYVTETLKDSDESCPVAREFRAVFDGCIDWLAQQKEGQDDK